VKESTICGTKLSPFYPATYEPKSTLRLLLATAPGQHDVSCIRNVIESTTCSAKVIPAPSWEDVNCTHLLISLILRQAKKMSVALSSQKAHSTVETCAIAASSATEKHATWHIARDDEPSRFHQSTTGPKWLWRQEPCRRAVPLPWKNNWRDSDDKSHLDE